MRDIRKITLHGTYQEVEFDYWKSKRCDKCGKKIWLARNHKGRYTPIEEKDISGSPVFISHFAECQAVREIKKA